MCESECDAPKDMTTLIKKYLLLAAAAVVGILPIFTFSSRAAEESTAPAEPKDASEVFERYTRAAGGKDAINAIHSRVTKAEATLEEYSVTGKVEMVQKAPNLFLGAWRLDDVGSFDRGFDGKLGWSNSPFDGVREQSGLGLALLKEEAELRLTARMKEFFPGAKLADKKAWKGHQVHVVEVPGKDKAGELYFDVKTELLVGWKRQVESQSGITTEEAKLEEYRAVDGVKIPFLITKSTPELTSITKVTEVKHNVDVADSKFVKPAN